MMSEPRHWPGREGRQNESRDRVMRKPLVVGWTKKVWRVVLKAGRWEGEGNLSNRRAHPDSKVTAFWRLQGLEWMAKGMGTDSLKYTSEMGRKTVLLDAGDGENGA